jgi:complement component 1 Q subcomponent-binding protein
MRLAQNILRRGPPLVRAVGRSTPRLTTSMLSQRIGSSANAQTTTLTFSVRSFSAQSELLDILAREEQEEVGDGNKELPQELADLKTSLESDWRIVDDGAMTQLFLKDKKGVQVSFHCQDTVADDDNNDEVFDEAAEDDEEEPAQAVRFTVTISKAGKTIVVNCLSEFGEGKIEGVTTTAATADVIHANQGVVEKGDYQGPDFLELAEDLQEAFGVYFEEECGITSDVASFVAMYTDYKEQLQYVQFLEDAQSVIS